MYPSAPNHKLGTFLQYCRIDNDGTFHRALADAEMTGNLWIVMIDEIKGSFGINHVSFELMQKLSKITKAMAPAFLEKAASRQD